MLITNLDGVVLFIAQTVEQVEQGLWVNKGKPEEVIFADLDGIRQEDVAVPDWVMPIKHKYVDGEFVTNPEYNEPNDMKTEVERLRDQVTLLQAAMDNLILGSEL